MVVLKYLGAIYLAYFTYLCFRDALRDKVETLSPAQIEPNKTQQIDAFDGGDLGGSSPVDTRRRTTCLRQHVRQSSWVKPAVATLAICWLILAAYAHLLV